MLFGAGFLDVLAEEIFGGRVTEEEEKGGWRMSF